MARKTPETNRRDRIDAARRKERAAERRRTFFAVGGAAVAALALIAGAVFLDRGTSTKDTPEQQSEALAKLGVAEADAGCAPIEDADPIPTGSKHVTGDVNWPEVPPMGGPHSGTTLRNLKNFYSRGDDPKPEQVVHDMEHGLVVGWFDKKLSDDEVDVLKKVAAATTKRFLAVAWERADFTGDRHFVLTAWGHTQRCKRVSGAVIDAFVKKYVDGKDAPERGAPV